MIKIPTVVTLLLLGVTPVYSQPMVGDPGMSATGWSRCVGGACDWGIGALPNPHIVTVPQPDSDEGKTAQKRSDADWAKVCDAHPVRDRYGVMRMQYNAQGCEFGSHP